MTEDASQKKIIVDEDWKAQVQAEKEAQKAAQQESPQEQQPAGDENLPPPTFTEHILSLASQAMVLMGRVPNPHTGKPEVHLGYARHLIDTIEMLEEKTQGNRTPEEIALLSQVLHELRMTYVSVQDGTAASTSK